MLLRRCSATIAVVAALACVVGFVGETSAAPPDRSAPVVTVRAAVGVPPVNAPFSPGSVFNFPNRSKAERVAIRKRVLNTIKSTWGGVRDGYGAARPTNGTIRIATWTFKDWAIARALYQAHRRGVSVQVVAAARPNRSHRPWKWLRQRLHGALYRAGHPETTERWSFARQCRGSCRGRGGTPHSKYFLFTNVGAAHVPTVTVQSSTNLTRMGFQGQWNHATTTWDRGVHAAFSTIFRETRLDRPVASTYRRYANGGIQSIFFPRPGATPAYDPIMQALSPVRCAGASSGGDARRRTQIRIIQYAIYDTRGAWIAKRLRALWNAGCNIKIIYSVSSRAVLSILRSSAGRGPVPMRQSVIRNGADDIIKYNHSKWMTITGSWGSSKMAWVVLPGSANWADLAFSSDEQMQQIHSYRYTRAYLAAFEKTWRQRTSRKPRFGRALAAARFVPGVSGEPVFGKGVYKHLPED